jgi:3-dehydroquinate synthase
MQHIIITDHTTKKLFGSKVQKQYRNAKIISVEPGEKSKSREQKAKIEDKMISLGCNRQTKIIALGGGVIGDLAGFTAATYMRGIPYIQIPTTLLAMVDSSVGGKTAIDTKHGKNLIGAFHQPEKTIIDISYLKTLPKRHMINGLVEAIKMFITSDKRSFRFVQKNLDKILEKDPKTLESLISRAVKIKKKVVKRDEKEKGLRAILNFGHTVGHAIELLSNYKMDHGHAVALGILAEARMAKISKRNYKKIEELLNRLGFDPKELKKFKKKDLLNAMKSDKKGQNYVRIKRIGKVAKQLLHKVPRYGW